ncbi:MAG: DEAD/DEAH box helicase [Verrucomicrobiota bacterium]
MTKTTRKTTTTHRAASGTAKYDAHNTVLSKTYGALADLRRELSDSKAAVAERTELLRVFSDCTDSQRAWLLLEDYFEKLSLSRKDFAGQEWWPRLMSVQGKKRLEETAILFLRSNRPLPTELSTHANLDRFAEVEEAEAEQKFVQQLEHWLYPPTPTHLDAPRAALRVICEPKAGENDSALLTLSIEFHLFRPRTGEKTKTLSEIVELTTRSAHEQELFTPSDWELIRWLAETNADPEGLWPHLALNGLELFQWLVRWGEKSRLLLGPGHEPIKFHGHLAELKPNLEKVGDNLSFTHNLVLPDGEIHSLQAVKFFAGRPSLVLIGNTFYLLRNGPPSELLDAWAKKKSVPVSKLSHRLLTKLRKNESNNGVDWEQLCVAHQARPQFIFELSNDRILLRLQARSERDQTLWHWTGHEWQLREPVICAKQKPEILDDPRLEPAVQWLRRLDWFTPSPGVWSGDANENFLNSLAAIWAIRPEEADYLGDSAFHRLFLTPRQMRPRLVVKGSGIDWFSVSTEWEMEGMKLTQSDLDRLQTATGRFVHLPDAGWVELDSDAVQTAHEAFADLGLENLSASAQKLGLERAAHLDETGLGRFSDSPQARALRKSLADFTGIVSTELPSNINAELRPYQKEGFDFLCHLTRHKLGGILADDMGLGKTLQTLAWLSWLRAENPKSPKPALVICPASVLHNWRREAERFAPHLKVLVLESGAARHNLRQKIPQHDIIVTNYALLRRDLEALQKFQFRAVVLDEAQFIKNPDAQVTQSVKQLKAEQRLALTGTPLENRLLDLWSITDFVQPGFLGTKETFSEKYEPRANAERGMRNAENSENKVPGSELEARIARRRLSSKLRPLLLRRLKKQVARDLPDRIEERRDCDLGEAQRKLYLAELRRSREQIMQTVAEKGIGKSTIHVLAALTRLRQICCHPQLVGNDSSSGKTDTLFELLEPLLADNQKVLVFSQFVQMLKLLEKEFQQREISTHMLTGETKDRQNVVNAFQEETKGSVFLLSLRAAGTGLNLTTASYVVLYDPWWNPAVEAQAIDRSHRIGQTRTVNAYRLIAPGTVEEKIWDLQQRKAQTIADVLGEEGFAKSLSKMDLEYLFSED